MLTQIDTAHPVSSDTRIHTAGLLALAVGVIAALGVLLLIAMFAAFARSATGAGLRFGMYNDICVALQYALTIPLALLLHRLLQSHNARWMRLATVVGIAGMAAITLLQVALVLNLLAFEQQVVWVTLAMFGAVGPWLVMTGLVARATGKLPHSLAMSLLAVPYLGFPVWAIWLGRRLLAW